jgi:hypothetical protein
MNGYSISVIPKSRAAGKKTRADGKSTWSLGPFRFSISRNLPTWKAAKQKAEQH